MLYNAYLIEDEPQFNTNIFITSILLVASLFRVHSLTGGNGNHIIDILYGAAARQVVDRTCDTLQDRTNGYGITSALYEFITDITYLQVREYEDVCLTCDL